MNEEMFDMKNLLFIKKVYTKYLTEKTKNDHLLASFAIFADALKNNEFHSQQELSEFLGCNKAHTSRTLIKMTMRGLIKPTLTLTDKGIKLAMDVQECKQKLKQKLIADIPKNDLITFTKVLNQIAENAQKYQNWGENLWKKNLELLM